MYNVDLDHISFAEWLVQLDKHAAKAGYKTEQPFSQVTGQLDWHSCYEKGLSPAAALDDAARDGFGYGRDYDD